MEKYDLSRMYATATSRCSESMTEFYEQIHDMFGEPVIEIEYIEASLRTIKKIVNSELDLIKQACIQYNEQEIQQRNKRASESITAGGVKQHGDSLHPDKEQ